MHLFVFRSSLSADGASLLLRLSSTNVRVHMSILEGFHGKREKVDSFWTAWRDTFHLS